jgi:hypothetical protein
MKAFATAVQEVEINYHVAYNAWRDRRFDATRIQVGGKKVLLLDEEQQRAFFEWAKQHKENHDDRQA